MEPDPDLLTELPPLVRAAALGDLEAVESLLISSSPEQATDDGWTALHAAANFDRLSIVKRLLRAGAQVDARTSDGFTPLVNASRASASVIDALLEAGADPDARADIGWSALDRLASYGNHEGLKVVLGAIRDDVDRRSGEDEPTALMDAAEHGSTQCVELLLAAGADASLTSSGETAADLAAQQGHAALAARIRDATR